MRKKTDGRRCVVVLFIFVILLCRDVTSEALSTKALNLIPTPQYVETLEMEIILSGSRPIRIIADIKSDRKIELAAHMLKEDFERREPRLRGKVSITEAGQESDTSIYLAALPQTTQLGIHLNVLDQQVLSQRFYGQSYILRTLNDRTLWIVGSPQGVLYGAMTLLQLVKEGSAGLIVPGIYIRDFPHFEYRAASDWLLNGEANRWSLDRGQGLASYERLCKQKLDQCLKYKINMVFFDGFGWGLSQRFPEYPALMRRLNAYARQRGIYLTFGGYGAGYGMVYQKGPLYEEGAYLGQVFYNRESYPNGATYSCMGFPRARKGQDPSVLGTCRANDELNRLKAKELQEFVRAVEPGALYIHHEDFGGYDETESFWKRRDARCRQRWPNDDLGAPDGGAGGLAHGYSWFINAINQVQSAETGYDASRDCKIILVSPVYRPDSPTSEHWGKVLRLWRNIGERLPRASNVMVCFREVFPQPFGPGKWTDSFNSAMREAGLNWGAFIFFLGGADNYLNDYPLVATPIMNALFLGAQAVYNFSGDAYQEPQQLLNAEYSWNVFSYGFYKDPQRYPEAVELWRALMYNDMDLEEIFGERGFLRRACERLYGPWAAIPMTKYYREHRELPTDKAISPASGRSDRRNINYLPMAWDKIYAMPYYWRHLALDAKTWTAEIDNEAYLQAMQRLNLSRTELHLRLKRRWQLALEMSEQGESYLKQALSSSPAESSRDDLQFLLKSTQTMIPLAKALMDFHEAMHWQLQGYGDPRSAKELLTRALANADKAASLAQAFFPNVIDPLGADVGALKSHLRGLKTAIQRIRDQH